MPNPVFFYRQDGILRRIMLDNVLLLETTGNYVKFHELNGFHLVRTSLATVLEVLPKGQFVQISRSMAIAVEHLDLIRRDTVTLLSGSIEFTLSRKYYDGLMKRITILGSEGDEQKENEQENKKEPGL